MLWPKKNSYKEFENEKKFLRLENSPPPHNFSNGPSLNWFQQILRDYKIFTIIGQRFFNPINAVPRELHTPPGKLRGDASWTSSKKNIKK